MRRLLAMVWCVAVVSLISPRLLSAQVAQQTCTFQTDPRVELLKKGEHAVEAAIKKLTNDYSEGNRESLTKSTNDLIWLQKLVGQSLASRLLKVTSRVRIAIQLSNPPPTRLRVSFDTTSGLHQEADWDPAVSSELLRFVVLEEGDWTVSVSAEPSPYTQQEGLVVIQTRFDPFRLEGKDVAKVVGTYVAMVAGGTRSIDTPLELTTWPRPQLTFDCGVKRTFIENEQFVSPHAVVNSGLRGFGVAPAFVTETLAILTEVAMERAKAGALRLLKDRIVNPFCSDDKTKLTLKMLGLKGDGLVLPRACALLQTLRLEDILSSGRALLYSLRDDLRYTVATAVVDTFGGSGLMAPALRAVMTVLNTAVDRGGVDGLEIQLGLELLGNMKKLAPHLSPEMKESLRAKLSQIPKEQLDGMLSKPIGAWDLSTYVDEIVKASHSIDTLRNVLGHVCQARLVVAVIKRCSTGSCSVGEIAYTLASPENVFAVDHALPLALCWEATMSSVKKYLQPEGSLAQAQQLVVEGLKLLAPVADAQGRDRAKAAIRLIIHLAKRWHGEQDSTTVHRLNVFSETAIALIDEDYGIAISRALSIFDMQEAPVPQGWSKMTRLLGAVAAYAAVYRTTKDEDPKMAHEARKKALASIIDSATDRSERGEDWITSLGSNVGLSATWSRLALAEEESTLFSPGLRLPLAARIEWFPSVAKHGGHLAFQLIDLGQFVRRGGEGELGDVHWADFVSPGIELGYNLGVLGDRALNISIHGAYAPSIEQRSGDTGITSDGVWRFGVALSYYVPFFDFN